VYPIIKQKPAGCIGHLDNLVIGHMGKMGDLTSR
jgi:hypothetical protein